MVWIQAPPSRELFKIPIFFTSWRASCFCRSVEVRTQSTDLRKFEYTFEGLNFGILCCGKDE
ncbi:proline-rich receptor-like protein kinase PERK8 [Gossypium australe]|uniref:Proline-rich receptor-like protein kinase PERK8 n=1 Tax=Gossypium australe TaxID=47621 RepID=A0A5B6W4K5_9ROSI|nr:proline-rich receptor-like protein kinase PERK8 [Gossypium australe]